MPTVFLCSPTNSAMFTTCCQVAITDREDRCSVCKKEITPQGRDARWEAAYGPIRRKERSYG